MEHFASHMRAAWAALTLGGLLGLELPTASAAPLAPTPHGEVQEAEEEPGAQQPEAEQPEAEQSGEPNHDEKEAPSPAEPSAELGSSSVQNAPAAADEPLRPQPTDARVQERDTAARSRFRGVPGWTRKVLPEPRTPSDVTWQLLRLPELFMRLAVSPFYPLVVLTEETRVELRLKDLLTNRDGTATLLPIIALFGRDPLGVGARYKHTNFFGDEERFAVSAIFKTNGDEKVELTYSEEVPGLNGQLAEAEISHDLDHNERYYGLGNGTGPGDERALEHASARVAVEVGLGGPSTDLASFNSKLGFGYRSEALSAGEDPTMQPLGEVGDTVPLPPGFDERLDFAELAWAFSHDLRDSEGRTHRGWLGQLTLSAITDLNDVGLTAARAEAASAIYIPVAPRHRVLVWSLGATVTTPLAADDSVPLHGLVRLGRSNHLRGYRKRRFRGEHGWWSSLEYRYPIFDFKDTGFGLSSTLFTDVGCVANDLADLACQPLRRSHGFGLRAESASYFIFRVQTALSPEGIEFLASMNQQL